MERTLKPSFVKETLIKHGYRKEIDEEIKCILPILDQANGMYNESYIDISRFIEFRNNRDISNIIGLNTADRIFDMVNHSTSKQIGLKEAMKVAKIGNMLLEFDVEKLEDEVFNISKFFGESATYNEDELTYTINFKGTLKENLLDIRKDATEQGNILEQTTETNSPSVNDKDKLIESTQRLLLVKELIATLV